MGSNFETETSFVTWVEKMVDRDNNKLGHNEDAIAFPLSDVEYMIINIDGWVASTDMPSGMNFYQAGYRAVANAISDVIVKGAKPEGMIISMSISDEKKTYIQEIIKGFYQASLDFKTPYLGGDMNSSSDLVIDVTVWGRTNRIIHRSGARLGDKVYWLGPALGCTAAAIGILTKNWKGDREKAIKTMGQPNLYPHFLEFTANSATDSSDGLVRSLYNIADPSKVAITLGDFTSSVRNIPTWISEVSSLNNLDLMELFFYGGEELGIVFTSNEEILEPDVIELGVVTSGDGVWFEGERLNNTGWDHFSS